MSGHLLVVTLGGFGKRVALSDLEATKHAGTRGVRLSAAEPAAVLVVGRAGDVMIATVGSKLQRIKITDVPTRRRDSWRSKGARIIRLAEGDQVASVALAAEDPVAAAEITPSDGLEAPTWPGGRVGLSDGEEPAQITVLRPLLPLAAGRPGGRLADPDWARTEVHRHSRYWCVHCGREHPDPDHVYACIDRHANDAEMTGAGGRRSVARSSTS